MAHLHPQWPTGTPDILNDFFKITAPQSAEILEREARELRIRHNDLAPISQLPPEILADVFVRCVPTSIHQLQTDLSWLNVAQVASRWRTIALACPDLWSSLVFSRPNLTPLLLERAKNASLVVRSNLRKHFDNSPEPILLEHASQLGTLDICSPHYYLPTFLANLEQADAAPRLQCVKIVKTHYGVDEEIFDPAEVDAMWLPRNLFCRDQVLQTRKPGVHPVLRLHLESCAFPWDSGWYSHLTHLHLEDIDLALCPTMEEFLAVLARSPALESLSLIHCMPRKQEDGQVVALPRLSTLTMKSCPSESWAYARFWGFLSVPATAVVHVSCAVYAEDLQQDSSAGDNDVVHQSICQVLICAFADIDPEAFDTVRIHHMNGLCLSVEHSARPDWARILLIDVPAKAWTSALEIRTTECLCSYLAFSSTTTLHLHASMKKAETNFEHFYTLSLWNNMGRAMPRVQTLHMSGAFPDAWLQFLLTQAMLLVGVSHFNSCFNRFPQEFRCAEGQLKHAWPALQHLTLNGLNMGGDYSPGQLVPSGAELLRALLWARCLGGAPIPQLKIEDCRNVNVVDVQELDVFAKVRWDREGITTAPVRRLALSAQGEEFENEQEEEEAKESLEVYSVGVFVNMILHPRR